MTSQQAFELAFQHHQSGRLAEAEAFYRQILVADPRHADALHLLGVIAHQVGRNEAAVDLIHQAIDVAPGVASFYFSLGDAYRATRQLDQAIQRYRQAIALRPEHADSHHNLAAALRALGIRDQAIVHFRQAIILRPNYPEAHNNLGNVLKETGKLDEAIAAYRQAIALKENFPQAYVNLGNACFDQGKLDEAVAACQQAITLNPELAEAHYNCGNAFTAKGHPEEAIAAYRRAIDLKAGYAEAYSNLGNALKDMGRLDEAIAAYRQAIALKPDYPLAHGNLGNAYRDQGKFAEAIVSHRQAIALNPVCPEAHSNLGNSLHDEGQLDAAIAAYRQAIGLDPNLPEVYSNLGNTLKDQGRLDEAIATYRQAIVLKPDFPLAHGNLGVFLHDKGQLDEAIAACRQAIELKPDYAYAYNNLGNSLKDTGRLDEAIAAYRQAIALKPDFSLAHSNLLLVLNYHPGCDASAIAEEARGWNRQHAEPLRPFILPNANERSPGRRLRIGYVSPDFREHSVAFFLEGLLDKHDRGQVELFCYSDVAHPDAVTARMQKSAGYWRKIAGMPDAQVADQICRDGIDILVDLAGHTANNRLLVFAREPTPVQVSWLGYPNTTGLESIDYRLTDAIADPPGSTEHLHTEQLVRLPETFACFRPAGDSPAVGPLPVLARGHITFGSFHTLAKLNDELLEHWVKILKEAAGSRLLLVSGGLNDRSCQRRFIEFFEKQGIDPGRLEFRGRQNLEQYLALHHEVDILLDSHPFSGHTVSCHALWMGVPVVTLAGSVHCSRMVASVLTNVGLPELIAQTPWQYVEVACELARDLPRLAGLRSTLRQRMEASPLMDAPRFARAIESAYREMWRKWCANETRTMRKAVADD